MTAQTFFEYIANAFLPFVKNHGIALPIVVFLDGHVSHLSLELSEFCSANGIILVALHPNATNICQPLDVAVFGPMKKKWKNICRQWRVEHDGHEITKENVPSALDRLISDRNMKNNVISGFRATGIFPFKAENVDYSKLIQRPDTHVMNSKLVF